MKVCSFNIHMISINAHNREHLIDYHNLPMVPRFLVGQDYNAINKLLSLKSRFAFSLRWANHTIERHRRF